jgi:hypothetical protein
MVGVVTANFRPAWRTEQGDVGLLGEKSLEFFNGADIAPGLLLDDSGFAAIEPGQERFGFPGFQGCKDLRDGSHGFLS